MLAKRRADCQFCRIRGSECFLCQADRLRAQARSDRIREDCLEAAGWLGPAVLLWLGGFLTGVALMGWPR